MTIGAARRGRRCLLLAMAIAVPPLNSAAAGQGDGPGYVYARDLLARCSGPSSPGLDYCFGYIASVHDTVRAYEAWLSFRELCIPQRTPQAELKDVFVDYLRRHSNDLDGQAASVVVLALRERYPCPPPAPAAPVPQSNGQTPQ
jgi:Rap1a immunity proteins